MVSVRYPLLPAESANRVTGNGGFGHLSLIDVMSETLVIPVVKKFFGSLI